MKMNERPWTKEHDIDEWHCYLNGDFEPALCGKKPIPGMPIVARHPDQLTGMVCAKCLSEYLKETYIDEYPN